MAGNRSIDFASIQLFFSTLGLRFVLILHLGSSILLINISLIGAAQTRSHRPRSFQPKDPGWIDPLYEREPWLIGDPFI